MSSQCLFIIDISSFIFRAFYAVRPLHNPKGEPTNAVFGVATMLARLMNESQPENLVVAFDSKEPSFRKIKFAEYKANRSAPPEDLIPQFDKIEELVNLLKIPSCRISGVEADDIIAYYTQEWLSQDEKNNVVIVTGDKDLMQLVNERVLVWDTMANRRFNSAAVTEKFGIPPENIRDYLAIVGDSSDNIPGVSGIGPKGAVDLLKQYQSLEGILQAAKEGKLVGKKNVVFKEQEQKALLSQELTTLDTNAVKNKIETLRCEKLKFQKQYSTELENFLIRENFLSLQKQWSQWGVDHQLGQGFSSIPETKGGLAPVPEGVIFELVQNSEKLQQVCNELFLKKEFAIDTETTSLNPRDAKIVGVSLCMDETKAYYIPIAHEALGNDGKMERLAGQLNEKEVLNSLKPFLENPLFKKVGQNLKYDCSIFFAHGITVRGYAGDTMIADYILNPEGRHGLDFLAEKYLQYRMISFEEICGKGRNAISFSEVSIETALRYSAEDAWATWKIWKLVSKDLQENRLMPVFAEIEMPLVHVLMKMEMHGVKVNQSYFEILASSFKEEIEAIEKKVSAIANEQGLSELNLNSPKQLAHFLFDVLRLPPQSKTKTGYSTDADVLTVLAPLHEVPQLLLEYREIAKLKGTYVDPMANLVHPKTGRVHSHFNQTVAATGRLSSNDPNLQNIPTRTKRGELIRKGFVAPEGYSLLAADYSQIELRLLAHMSGDQDLIESFRSGQDVHKRTAAEMFMCQVDNVTDQMRSVAKAINFGLMYGKTAHGLSLEVNITRKEAQQWIDRYFERYSGVKKFLETQIQSAREKGWVQTLSGRRRILKDILSKNFAMRGFAERMAMNTPIQGTAADLIKIAMIHFNDFLEENYTDVHMIIQVHDEIVVEVPDSKIAVIAENLVRIMEGAMSLSVPLEVNLAVGKNWLEMSDFIQVK